MYKKIYYGVTTVLPTHASYARAKRYDNLAEIRRRIGKRFNYRTKGYYRTVRLI